MARSSHIYLYLCTKMNGKRIEYIDAMRGFTMILVVYSHVCHYCFGDPWIGFNDVFFLFRLPCFFMISGWLFEPTSHKPFWPVVRRKFKVQIVPTFIFLLLLAPPPLFFSRLGATKGGYWFTFALFCFFVICLLATRLGRAWGSVIAVLVSVSAFCYDVFYNHIVTTHQSPLTTHLSQLLGFISFMTWRYYLFFYLGTLIRRHFNTFLCLTSRPLVMLAVVAGFVGVTLIPHTDNVAIEYFIFAMGGVLGMTMIFTIFRTLSPLFSHLSPLQYIGCRTLDIYLLHYFFLPRFLIPYARQFHIPDNSLPCLLLGLLLALLIVGVCLLVSRIIRLSPFLGHWLFGVKYEKQ